VLNKSQPAAIFGNDFSLLSHKIKMASLHHEQNVPEDKDTKNIRSFGNTYCKQDKIAPTQRAIFINQHSFN